MKFLLIAYDGKDEGALERRMAVRPTHLEGVDKLSAAGTLEVGGAILDEAGHMIGSMCVFEFPDREALDAYLEKEPYVTGNVWQDITIAPFGRAV